jgi:hypothetical protein
MNDSHPNRLSDRQGNTLDKAERIDGGIIVGSLTKGGLEIVFLAALFMGNGNDDVVGSNAMNSF